MRDANPNSRVGLTVVLLHDLVDFILAYDLVTVDVKLGGLFGFQLGSVLNVLFVGHMRSTFHSFLILNLKNNLVVSQIENKRPTIITYNQAKIKWQTTVPEGVP